jgi:hypothetical protein
MSKVFEKGILKIVESHDEGKNLLTDESQGIAIYEVNGP